MAGSINDDAHPQWKVEAWTAEAVDRFGEHPRRWAFVCPQCKTVSTAGDFADLDVDGGRAAHECIGRVLNEQGADPRHTTSNGTEHCDWASFGLFRGPVTVTKRDGKETHAFRFADPEPRAS